MKNNHTSFLLLALFTLLVAGRCRKELTPLEQLPPATQTGANTFGCVVNGKAFTPKGSSLAGPILQANYQLIYAPSPTGYILGITGRDRSTDEITSISIGFDSLAAEEGKKYQLTTISKGNAGGQYGLYPPIGSYQIFQTNNTATGELWIKRFDLSNQIVSGTFWFDAINSNGQKVEVREGRFDVRYTK